MGINRLMFFWLVATGWEIFSTGWGYSSSGIYWFKNPQPVDRRNTPVSRSSQPVDTAKFCEHHQNASGQFVAQPHYNSLEQGKRVDLGYEETNNCTDCFFMLIKTNNTIRYQKKVGQSEILLLHKDLQKHYNLSLNSRTMSTKLNLTITSLGCLRTI